MTSVTKLIPDVLPGQELPSDALRAMVAAVVQDALRAEFDHFVGAAPHARSPTRRARRNGSSEQALVLALIEMYLHGVSPRKVSGIVEALCGTTISASEVSALTRKLDASLTAWRERRVDDTPYRYLIVDAHVEHVRREGHVRSTAALWVVGVTADGYREHLGVWMGPSESEASWASVFHDLVERGLHGVTYVVSDEHAGLVAALRRYFPEAVHQRCQVHYLRNALAKVTSEHVQTTVVTGLRDAWSATTREEAAHRIAALVTTLQPLAPRLADWLADTHAATLACYTLPAGRAIPTVKNALRSDLRTKLRSTNSLEQHHALIRRRTRVIRIFPHEASLQRLLTALAMAQNDRWRVQRWVIADPSFPRAPEVAAP